MFYKHTQTIGGAIRVDLEGLEEQVGRDILACYLISKDYYSSFGAASQSQHTMVLEMEELHVMRLLHQRRTLDSLLGRLKPRKDKILIVLS